MKSQLLISLWLISQISNFPLFYSFQYSTEILYVAAQILEYINHSWLKVHVWQFWQLIGQLPDLFKSIILCIFPCFSVSSCIEYTYLLINSTYYRNNVSSWIRLPCSREDSYLFLVTNRVGTHDLNLVTEWADLKVEFSFYVLSH